MAYSYFDYEGTDTTIQTDILCVSTEHMYAFKVLSEDEYTVTLSPVALAATFTKNNAGVLCELGTAPSTKIRVIRSTPYDVLMHDFSNGAQFNAFSVDEVYEQVLYLCQELVEGKLIIDSSGNFVGTREGINPKELQEQLAAQYSMGYSVGLAHQDKELEGMINKVAAEAFNLRGELGVRNLDDITGSNAANYGLWHQTSNSNATQERGYPSSKAGVMLMVPAAYHGMQIYIPFDGNSIFKRTTGSESENYVYQPWQELGSAKSNVSVLTGTIADGGTIPLPSGYTASQCKWMVSLNQDNPDLVEWTGNDNDSREFRATQCSVDSNRKVAVRLNTGTNANRTASWTVGNIIPGRANYIVIGVK